MLVCMDICVASFAVFLCLLMDMKRKDRRAARFLILILMSYTALESETAQQWVKDWRS